MALLDLIMLAYVVAFGLQSHSPPGKLPPPSDSIGRIAFESLSEAMPVDALSSTEAYISIDYAKDSAVDPQTSSDRIVVTDGVYYYFSPRSIKSIRTHPQRYSESPIPVIWLNFEEFSFACMWGAVPPQDGDEVLELAADDSKFVRLVSRIGGTKSLRIDRSIRLIESRGYDPKAVGVAYDEARRFVRESPDREVLNLALAANGGTLRRSDSLSTAMIQVIAVYLRDTIETADAKYDGKVIRIRGGDDTEVAMLPTNIEPSDEGAHRQAWQWFEFDSRGWATRQGALILAFDQDATLSDRADKAAGILIGILTGREPHLSPAARDGVQNVTTSSDR